jgi:hypothetical protein
MTSQAGREVLAEVLEAAAGVLKRARDTGNQIADAGSAAMDTGSNVVSRAVGMTTDAAAGAIETSGEIAAAATEMVQTAVGTLANMATGGARELSRETSGEEEGKGRRRSQKGS